jgi:ABC-type uncharacterized transport system YnjBCD permease subunit
MLVAAAAELTLLPQLLELVGHQLEETVQRAEMVLPHLLQIVEAAAAAGQRVLMVETGLLARSSLRTHRPTQASAQ